MELTKEEVKATVSERIKNLRTSRNLSQKYIAESVNMTEAGYQNYEVGRRAPTLEKLIALADFFQVSTDYLLGRTDKP